MLARRIHSCFLGAGQADEICVLVAHVRRVRAGQALAMPRVLGAWITGGEHAAVRARPWACEGTLA